MQGYVVIWEWMRVVIQNLNFMSLIKHLVSKECTNEVIRGVHGHDNVQLHCIHSGASWTRGFVGELSGKNVSKTGM